jgi:hypothetical protein
MERAKGIEPSSSPWEGDILPVYYARDRESVGGIPFLYAIVIE